MFNQPILSPNGTILVIEGANIDLFCSSNLNNLTVTWTRDYTQLAMATSTSSLTYTIQNIMMSESGNYTCSVMTTIGTNEFTITRKSSVIIKVFRKCYLVT